MARLAVFVILISALISSLTLQAGFLVNFNDKLTHSVGYGVLALLAFAGWPQRRRLVALLAFCLGALIEVLQVWHPTREFSVGDLSANLAGIVGATAIAWILKTLWQYRQTSPNSRLK